MIALANLAGVVVVVAATASVAATTFDILEARHNLHEVLSKAYLLHSYHINQLLIFFKSSTLAVRDFTKEQQVW